MKKNRPNSSTEKRILWEVKQRYKINQPLSKTRQSSHNNIATSKNTLSARVKPPIQQTQRNKVTTKRKKSKLARIVVLTLFLAMILSGGTFGYKILSASNKISTTQKSVLGQLSDLLFSQGKHLSGEKDGRINILLIAIGGEGHKGRNLADTIMLASFNTDTKQVALMSIPRDLYVKVPGKDFHSKINAVHAYGEAEKKNYGPTLLEKSIEEITGQPIHYYIRTDFTAFKEMVDAVGGINITIKKSFFDYWHKISFPAGTEKMNGERALAYVRARYVEGSEGGDTKRQARQQQVLLALKEKIFSVNTAFSFSTLSTILNSLSNNLLTDAQPWEMKRAFEITRALDLNQNKLHSKVLTNGAHDVLVSSTEVLGQTPAFVFKTRTGDYSEIQEIAKNIFSAPEISATPTQEPPVTKEVEENKEAQENKEEKKSTEPITVEIRNGTTITGLAKKTGDSLNSTEYEVKKVGNAGSKNITKTTVYAISDNATDAVKKLANELDAKTDSGLPANEKSTDSAILVILGTDLE